MWRDVPCSFLGLSALFGTDKDLHHVPLHTRNLRVKRGRALKAVHELRAVSRILDMHQLAKNSNRIGHPTALLDAGGAVMDADAMGRYLHFCTELLAVLSKVGQVYVQDFPDAQALAAVDHFEELATGLSSKIWQKLMILDRVRSDAPPAAAPAPTVNGPAAVAG